MPLPDNYRARRGDIVILHARANRNDRDEGGEGSYLSVTVLGSHGTTIVERSEIVGIYRLDFDQGEEAARRDGTGNVTIIALDEDEAWVKNSDGTRASLPVSELERLPPKPDPVDEPFVEEAPAPAPAAEG